MIKRPDMIGNNWGKQFQSGKKHPRWTENLTYNALHDWLRKNFKKPKYCERCGKEKPLDFSNISGKYKRDIKDYECICRKCHFEKDGIVKNFHWKSGKKIKVWNKGKKLHYPVWSKGLTKHDHPSLMRISQKMIGNDNWKGGDII